jgi:hypothetical protein
MNKLGKFNNFLDVIFPDKNLKKEVKIFYIEKQL